MTPCLLRWKLIGLSPPVPSRLRTQRVKKFDNYFGLVPDLRKKVRSASFKAFEYQGLLICRSSHDASSPYQVVLTL